jgi:hypothetical protein
MDFQVEKDEQNDGDGTQNQELSPVTVESNIVGVFHLLTKIIITKNSKIEKLN